MVEAVHAASPGVAPTVTVCAPPTAGAAQIVGVTEKVAVPAAWVTVTIWPAMVAVAVRAFTADGFAGAVNVTALLPIPFDALSVSHGWSLAAVHAASA